MGKPTDEKWQTTTDPTGHYLFPSGMYAGVLWHLWHYTGDQSWKGLAMKATDGENAAQNVTRSHDIGFAIDNTYGLGYDLTKNESYVDVIVNAAKHMAGRYSGMSALKKYII